MFLGGCGGKASESAAPRGNEVILFSENFNERPRAGEYELFVILDHPNRSQSVARAVARKDGKGKFVRVGVTPHLPLGAFVTLKFRYRLSGAHALTAQMFFVTENDNRNVQMTGSRQGEWVDASVDFSRDSKRNDGSTGPFPFASKIDDIFFFVDGTNVDLLIDDVILIGTPPPATQMVAN